MLNVAVLMYKYVVDAKRELFIPTTTLYALTVAITLS
jgi:hypothetical protein